MPSRRLPRPSALRRLAWLVAGIACAAPAAAAPRAPTTPEIHYTMVTHRFTVADAPGRDPDERDMGREVEWRYPVFDDPHDPATPALNAWMRHESLALLLVDVGDADRLTDAQVIAQASASREFIDNGIDEAGVQPDIALGRYRGVTEVSEGVGGAHPDHRVSAHLYSLDRHAEVEVASLFKPGAADELQELFDAQPEAECPDARFEWAQASLSALDTLSFEFPYQPGRTLENVDCTLLVIRSPKVTRLLKSARSLSPRFQVVEDHPAR